MEEYMGRIIFADDDVDYNDPYVEHLQLLGVYVEIVRNPEKLLSLLKHEKWDVIILDIMFPRGEVFTMEESLDNRRTGVLIIEKILHEFPDTINVSSQLIVRTAVTDNNELRDKCISLGISQENYFEKPGNLVKLALAIEKTINSKK